MEAMECAAWGSPEPVLVQVGRPTLSVYCMYVCR